MTSALTQPRWLVDPHAREIVAANGYRADGLPAWTTEPVNLGGQPDDGVAQCEDLQLEFVDGLLDALRAQFRDLHEGAGRAGADSVDRAGDAPRGAHVGHDRSPSIGDASTLAAEGAPPQSNADVEALASERRSA